MKKLLSLLLSVAMLLGCVAFAEGVDYTGTWVLTGAEADGVQMGPSTLALVGMDMKVTLNADGTAVLSAMGMEDAGTWVVTETGVSLTDASDVTNVMNYRDDMLVMEDAGAVMMFTREGAAPAIAESTGPVAQANVDPAAFEGQWLLTKVNMLGMEMPADAMGMYMAFVFADGTGILGDNSTEDGSIQTVNVVYTVEEIEGTGTALNVALEGAADEEPLYLFMAEEGYLFVSEEGVYMVFEKQVEEAAAE